MYPKIAALSLASLLVISGLMCQPAPKPDPSTTPLARATEKWVMLDHQNQELRAENAGLRAEVDRLQNRVVELRELATKYERALAEKPEPPKVVTKAAPVCTTGTCAPRVQYYYVPRQTAWYPGKRLFGGR